MKLLNINNLNTGDLDQILKFCKKRLSEMRGAFLIPMNPIKIIKARSNPDFQHIIDNCDWVFPDAWGVKWAASFLHNNNIPIIPGYKLMINLIEQAYGDERSIFFLGTRKKILEIAINRLKELYPGIKILGHHHGYFSEAEELTVFKNTVDLEPDYIFVAMGELKQEQVIVKLRKLYPYAVYLGVGGSIDLIADKQPSPPAWIRKNHLEWLFRLYKEPYRLPRYHALPTLVLLAILEKIKYLLR